MLFKKPGEFNMTKIVVNGASGTLGKLVVSELLKTVAPENLTLITRSPDKLSDLAAKGVRVCRGDYRDPESLEAAYAGNDTMLLISSIMVGRRVQEHRNAIESAKKSGIKHIVYTSVAGVHPGNPTVSAGDHIESERDLIESGLSYTIFRDQTYSEMFTPMAQSALMGGVWYQVGDKGKIAPVSRQDIARCAAVCLQEPTKHYRVTYELTGPDLLSFREISHMFSTLYNRPIQYEILTPDEMHEKFASWGIGRDVQEDATNPGVFWGSDELVSAYVAFDEGYHNILSHHVEFITGQKPVSLQQLIEEDKAAL
tara:strand:- start:5290 stop:6225 length:936 start_codon:yes stop_codon:yes gene_type:complete